MSRREVGTMGILVDIDLYLKLYNVLQTIAKSNPDSSSYSLVFTLQPVAPASVSKGSERGGNSMNVPPVNQACKSIDAFITYTLTHLSVRCRACNSSGMDRRRSRRHSSKTNPTAHVLHWCSCTCTKPSPKLQIHQWFFLPQSPLWSYGSELLEFLNTAREKWDPEAVFQQLQNGGFCFRKPEYNSGEILHMETIQAGYKTFNVSEQFPW